MMVYRKDHRYKGSVEISSDPLILQTATFAFAMDKKPGDTELADRKKDHIDLAFKASMANSGPDDRFYYEPALTGHPDANTDLSSQFLGKKLKAPLWVSSMTGGTEKAYTINHRLATSCARFGLGMGLGSCRPLLDGTDRLPDFDLRDIIGPDLPLYANLGIAQVETLLKEGTADRITELVAMLRADGLIVHINPLQEWLQPEGDRIHRSPVETIDALLRQTSFPVIVKEVGQGMGPESIKTLLQLPIAAFELAGHGGTNFSRLELLRSDEQNRDVYEGVSRLGHTALEMISWINDIAPHQETKCRQFILSGGIRDFLDGYYLLGKIQQPAVYGQASGFLKHAAISQEAIDNYIESQIRGLSMARAFLRVKS